MKFSRLHTWTDSIEEATKIQERFRTLISIKPERTSFKLIGGGDVAYSKKDDMAFATVVVMKVPEMELVERVRAQANITFPFMPGYFYFREGPVIIKALGRLKIVPDLFIFDAHGINHPKGIGMASHLGIVLDMPTIGCAKKLLCGSTDELGNEVGDTAPIYNQNKIAGMAIRSRQNVKPLFVSPATVHPKNNTSEASK